MKKENSADKFAVSTTNLNKQYPNSSKGLLYNKIFKRNVAGFEAVKDLSIDIPLGSCFGIIGLNGSGKSTLLQLLAGILEPTSGSVSIKGKIAAILELGSGFNYDFTGRENIAFYSQLMDGSNLNSSTREEEIIRFTELDEFIDRPLSTYSTGMVARLAFSVRVFLDFDILILDEVLSVGDIYFQRKCFRLFEEINEKNKTIIFVTHNTEQVLELCDCAMLLHNGEMMAFGKPKDCAYKYFEIITSKSNQSENFSKESNSENILGRGNCSLLEMNSSKGFTGDSLSLEFNDIVELKFYLYAHSALNELIFGFNFRSVCGSKITGNLIEIGNVKQNQRIVVHVTFRCIFNPGNYFLSCGITSDHAGERLFEARYLDYCLLSISNKEHRKFGGFVTIVDNIHVYKN